MDAGKIFVGRKAELEQFKEALNNPKGQAVLVVGQAGMGKSWLVNKMAKIAKNHPDLKCGCVRYEPTSNDSVDAMMERIMDDAFHAGDVVEGSFDNTVRRRKQWYSLLETVVPKGEKISKLIRSFERNQKRPTREEFLDRLRLISGKIEDNGRAVFIIDPLEYLERERDEYAEEWAIVVRDLPEKIKFVFAQRPEDALARYRKFAKLGNVERVPHSNLGKLKEKAVNELLDLRAGEMSYTITELRESLGRYEGHPYALQGALDMIATGTKLEELPDDTTETGIVEEQWSKICGYEEDAIHLFKAYAILEEAVPDEIVDNVAEIKADTRLALLAKNVFLDKLLYGEGDSKRIYHLLLSKYILNQMNDKEQKDYHSRAVEVYREKLAKSKEEQIRPDALAAMRLAEHVLAAEGKEAFVSAFVKECYKPLTTLGLFDAVISSSERALKMAEKDSGNEAALRGNLGLIYETRGELDKAEEMQLKSLEIEKKSGRLEGMANSYGNLGIVYYTRGDLDKAVEMHEKSLEIKERLGLQEGMANSYGNLGNVYCTRGDLDKAAEMHEKSLEIMERLGLQEGMANSYSNLGIVYRTQGDLDKAGEMHEKSLKIEKKLGRLEGMASDYNNLGLVYYTQGDLDKAEEMYLKSLEIEKKLWHLEGMANSYSNLGNVYYTRGELDKAEEMHEKSLKINEKLGRLEGMANDCGNLGNVYLMRGELDKAEEMYEKSLEINEKIGRLEGVANQYCSLGNIYYTRGELDKAEDMHEKSLEINEKIGRLEGMANDCGNLGNVYYMKGDVDKAQEIYQKALEIDEKIDHLEGVARHSSNLGLVYQKHGDISKAREYWEKAVELYKRIGMPHMVEKVEGWIEEIREK
jgi:tetratricopeptide (TPR) repeat protein